VKQATLVHVTSKRIQKLAKPKDVYPEYLMERTALMQVTPGAVLVGLGHVFFGLRKLFCVY